MGLGFNELLVIFLIVVILFGAKKIPELATGLGKGIKNFKDAMSQDEKKEETPTSTTQTSSSVEQSSHSTTVPSSSTTHKV